MESKKSLIARIPFSVILFFFGLVVFIDGFIWFAVGAPVLNRLSRVESEVVLSRRLQLPLVTPTATPSATVTPAQRVFLPPTQRITPVSK